MWKRVVEHAAAYCLTKFDARSQHTIIITTITISDRCFILNGMQHVGTVCLTFSISPAMPARLHPCRASLRFPVQDETAQFRSTQNLLTKTAGLGTFFWTRCFPVQSTIAIVLPLAGIRNCLKYWTLLNIIEHYWTIKEHDTDEYWWYLWPARVTGLFSRSYHGWPVTTCHDLSRPVTTCHDLSRLLPFWPEAPPAAPWRPWVCCDLSFFSFLHPFLHLSAPFSCSWTNGKSCSMETHGNGKQRFARLRCFL